MHKAPPVVEDDVPSYDTIVSGLSFLAGAKNVDDCFRDFKNSKIVGEGTYGIVRRCETVEGYRPSLMTGVVLAAGTVLAVKEHKRPDQVGGRPLPAFRAEEVNAQTLREIQVLRRHLSSNVVQMVDVLTSPEGGLYSVFEWCDHDLHKVIASGGLHRSPSPLATARAAFYQVMVGLRDLHAVSIGHRDIKPSNVLVTSSGDCRIGDLGLARVLDVVDDVRATTKAISNPIHQGPYSCGVCTAFYRPPELLLLSRVYDLSVDIWSAGALLAELLTMSPLFYSPERNTAHTQHEQFVLSKIFTLLGLPTKNHWPHGDILLRFARRLPRLTHVNAALSEYELVYSRRSGDPPGSAAEAQAKGQSAVAHEVLSLIGKGYNLAAEDRESIAKALGATTTELAEYLDLIGLMLRLDPNTRPSADEVLRHPFFSRHTVAPSIRTAVSFVERQRSAPQQPPEEQAGAARPPARPVPMRGAPPGRPRGRGRGGGRGVNLAGFV